MTEPLCACHGEPMIFHHDKNRPFRPEVGRPGYWRCRIKKRARDVRYGQTERGREQARAHYAKYARTEKGRRATRVKIARGTFRRRQSRIHELEEELSHR